MAITSVKSDSEKENVKLFASSLGFMSKYFFPKYHRRISLKFFAYIVAICARKFLNLQLIWIQAMTTERLPTVIENFDNLQLLTVTVSLTTNLAHSE